MSEDANEGVAPAGKKIAIFGTTPTRSEGPWQDDSGWERWTIGPGGSEAHGWERLYEIHSWWPEDFKGYLNFLSTRAEPQQVWTMRPMSELMAGWKKQHEKSDEDYAKDITGMFETNKVIPRQFLEEKYGRTWFMSSISWLFAQAIEDGATDIGLWGIDLEAGEERVSQFLGCRHFIDFARNVGINVHLPAGCGLTREPTPYPDRYETHFAMMTQRKGDWVRNALANLEREYDDTRSQMFRAEGGLMVMRQHGLGADLIKQTEAEMTQINVRVGELAANINHLKGELSATDFYRRMYVFEPNDPQVPQFPL